MNKILKNKNYFCSAFSHCYRSEKLDEKDVDFENGEDTLDNNLTNLVTGQSQMPVETDDVISNSQSNLKSSQEEEEEYVIEEFDD